MHANGVLASLRRYLAYQWSGPPDMSRAMRLEWRFISIRWIGIIALAPAVHLANLPGDRLLLVYLLVGVAAAYNLALQVVMPRRPKLFASGFVTTLGDGLLNIAMVSAGGGFDSPFYYILFSTTIAAAMRYGYRPSLAISLLYISFDATWHILDWVPFDAAFAFRSAFLSLTAILASYLREQADQAESALQERLRQANALNAATATLGASLEFETVLHTAAIAASHLFGTACTALQVSASLGGDASRPPCAIEHAAADCTTSHSDLLELCRGLLDAESSDRPSGSPVRRERLPSGEDVVVLTLALPSRRTPLACLATIVSADRPAVELDADVLDSFVERITLAIENASLYRTLARNSTDLQRAYADLATAHQELLGLDEMKTNFLANVSHELRTPLTSIRSFSELLLDFENDPSVQGEFLQIINSESERLTRLVNDVLDITKIESGHMDWQMKTTPLAELLHDSARTFGPLIAKNKLAFTCEIEEGLPLIHGDRDRLQQVVSNLLNNAMKFTREGTITLRARRLSDEIRISVSDTGIGIAEEDCERIFEKFQQVGDTLTDKPRGTGLGLAICRDIVHYHHGRLWVESTPGRGSTFTVALPNSIVVEQEPPAALRAA